MGLAGLRTVRWLYSPALPEPSVTGKERVGPWRDLGSLALLCCYCVTRCGFFDPSQPSLSAMRLPFELVERIINNLELLPPTKDTLEQTFSFSVLADLCCSEASVCDAKLLNASLAASTALNKDVCCAR